MKHWEKVINYKWEAGTSHAFLLSLSVDDVILNEASGKFETVQEYLLSSSVLGQSHFVAFFNVGSGIRFVSDEMEDWFKKFLAILHPEKDAAGTNAAVAMFEKFKRDPEYALGLFNEMLSISWDTPDEKIGRAILAAAGVKKNRTGKPFFSVVLEHVETMAPTDSATTTCHSDRSAMVLLEVWAGSKKIRDSKNILVMMAENIDQVAPELQSETKGVTQIQVQFPDYEDREKTIQAEHVTLKTKTVGVEVPALANLTGGMSRIAIRNLIKEAHARKMPLDTDRVFEVKKKFIVGKSGGLLEVIKVPWGIEAIGGLEPHKKYILEVVDAMKRGDLLAVPMGILLMGAPGTGKTVFAQAIAHEAGIPFLTMKNIREMWVGKSERNQSMVLEIIRANAPVAVFVDEADQEYQSRDVMFDNTGINNRMQAQLFQFTSNTDLRGRVLWIYATNRPDLLDPAMLRPGRMDIKIPFFPPSWQERAKILPAILSKLKTQLASMKRELKYEIRDEFYEEFGWQSHRHVTSDGIVPCDPEFHPRGKEDKEELPFTGGEIEYIVQNAYTIASNKKTVLGEADLMEALGDFVPGPKFGQSADMTKLALLYCSSERFIPEGKWREMARKVRMHQQTADQPQRTVLR